VSSGILVVDKPRGPTSHDIVAKLRRALGTRHVGHAGTLDPMATGVLVVAIDEATKLVPWLTAADKTYEATIRLGIATDTLDAEGRETDRVDVPENILRELADLDVLGEHFDFARREIGRAVAAEKDRSQQVPPAFSAIRIGGERAHDLARRGEAADLALRPISVKRLDVLGGGYAPEPHLKVALEVSKGYFVRSLARDLANALGTVGHLTSLRRTRSGMFTIEEAVAIDAPPLSVGELRPPTPPIEDSERSALRALRSSIIPLEIAASRALPVSTLSDAGVRAASFGQPVGAEDLRDPHPSPSAWLDAEGRLVAVGEVLPDGTGRVLRGFPSKC
jgi:tRNA pseudouridine55 synthase